MLFDYRDREDDRVAGVLSIVTNMKEENITKLFYFSIFLSAIFSGLLLLYGFGIFSVITLIIPVVITALLYNTARRNFNDILYYFVLDGLMAFSAFITLIASI